MTVPFGPWLVGFRGQVIPLFIVGDIISDNWDGLIPPNLSGTSPDLTATQGYALDASAGSAQFNGRLFIQGELKIGEDADVFIGGPGSTDSQLFIDNILEHLVLRETDDPDYPDIKLIYDINGRIGRIMLLDTTGAPTYTTFLRFLDTGEVDVNTPNGGLLRAGLPAYTYKETVAFGSSGTFTKGDYDGLRAVHYRMVAGGGAGGGAGTTAAGEASVGSGGGGGEYNEGWILAADLDTSEAVTVGAGGAGSAGAGGADGTDSVIDTIPGERRAEGGLGGNVGAAAVPAVAFASGGAGGGSGSVSDVQLQIPGSDGENGHASGATRVFPGGGGATLLGARRNQGVISTGTNGASGRSYGGGGAGGGNGQSQGSTRSGGAGADGLVMIDVYT